MRLTNDQYVALGKMQKWYNKYSRQFLDVSGSVGMGVWDLVEMFIENEEINRREIMYLSFDQKQVLELAAKGYHAYYINNVLYDYTRIVDFNTLSLINKYSTHTEYEWKKSVRDDIDPRYRLIIVLDSSLMSYSMLKDLSKFGLPTILLRDPLLLPSEDSYIRSDDRSDITLREVSEDYMKNPLIYFIYKFMEGKKVQYGNFDKVSIVERKHLNLYNLKSADMVLTMSDAMSDEVNKVYRNKIMNCKDSIVQRGERIIIMNSLYDEEIVDRNEERIKLYLTKGTIGTISRIRSHSTTTRYVPFDFTPHYYDRPFDDLVLDRFYLHDIKLKTRQEIPDEVVQAKYAYALTPSLARTSHWDKITFIYDSKELIPFDIASKILYTGLTRATKSMVIVL